MADFTDFLEGGLRGAGTGGLTSAALVKAGLVSNPWGWGILGASALGTGVLNYFASGEDEREAKEFNKMVKERHMDTHLQASQDLKQQKYHFGRQRKADKKMDTFRRLFSETF